MLTRVQKGLRKLVEFTKNAVSVNNGNILMGSTNIFSNESYGTITNKVEGKIQNFTVYLTFFFYIS